MNQLKAGVILSYLSILITIIIALFYTPIMIRLLGQSEYGLYSLIGSVVGYLSILDMGLGNAIIRYIAKNRAIGDKDEEAKLNGMFMVIYTFIGIITVIVGAILYFNIDNIFESNLTVSELEKAKIMVLLLIFNFALSFPLGVFSFIMQAYERFIAVKITSIIRSILIPCITLPILLIGYGSVSMVFVSTLVNITCLLFAAYYCFKYLNIKFYFGKFDFRLLREIAGYSFFIFLNVVVDKIYWSTNQFILGIVAGTAPVAIYAVAMQFINLYIMFSTSFSGLFLPRISIMVANSASNIDLTKEFIKFGRLQYIVMAYILSGFILYGQTFINFWIGYDYKDVFYITILLMIPLTIPLIQNTGIAILQAKNQHAFRSIVFIFIAILNIFASIPLAKNFGAVGSALATGISLIVGDIIIMNIYYHRRIELNIPLFWRNIILLSIPVVVSMFFGYGFNYLLQKDNILILFFKIVLFSISYLGLMWLFGFNSYEKMLFSVILKRIFRPLMLYK